MKNFKKTLAFFSGIHYNTKCVTGCGSAWLERHLREVEVASSNPATPTNKKCCKSCVYRTCGIFVFAGVQRVIKKESLQERKILQHFKG